MREERIGGQRLILGDCLEVMPTLGRVDAVVTDPPYGVNIGEHASAKDKRPGVLSKGSYASYADTEESLVVTVVPAVKTALGLAHRGLVFIAGSNAIHFPQPKSIGGVFVPAAVGRNAWGYTNFWPCLLYGSAPDLNLGARPTVLRSTATSEKNGHPTPKPVEWMQWAVSLSSRSDETILDPFMGSGTTLVACQKLGRHGIGIEIDKDYFEIACLRVEEAARQPDLFIAPAPKPQEEAMDL